MRIGVKFPPLLSLSLSSLEGLLPAYLLLPAVSMPGGESSSEEFVEDDSGGEEEEEDEGDSSAYESEEESEVQQ